LLPPIEDEMSHLNGLWQDFRFALRGLRKDLRFAALAILALGLGIGATTIIFSAIDGILLEPFPYRNPDRLVRFSIHDVTRPHEDGASAFTVPEFTAFREQNHVFEDVLGVDYFDVVYPTKEGTQLFEGCWVTANVSSFLGMKPYLGRPLIPHDATPGAPPVFAMTYAAWSKDFDRDPKILGRTMVLNGEPRTLVEILPPRFIMAGADFWMPIHAGHADIPDATAGNSPLYLDAFERLKRGVSIQEATTEIDVIAHGLSKVYPRNFPKNFSVIIRPMAQSLIGNFTGMLYALMGAVLMLLLVACSNIANLLLARATAREKEIAIRTSLGASRGRLIRQFLVESFILSAAGCVLGCFLAYFGLKGVVAEIPQGSIPRTAVIVLNSRALFFAVAIAMATTLLCGLAPAIHASRGRLHTALNGTGKGAGGNYGHGRLRAVLVIGEVALSILLLGGAGLMMRTLFAIERVDLGFNPANVLFARIPLPKGRYDTAQEKRIFFQQLLQRIAATPGVIAATEATSLPPYGGIQTELTVPGTTHSENWNSQLQLVSKDYFRTLEIHLLQGHFLSEEDVDSARHVAVVNQLLVHHYLSGENPIGKMIKFNFLDRVPDAPHDAYFEIIGVVANAKNQGIQDPPVPEAFIPYTTTGAFNRGIMVRTSGDPLALLPTVRHEVAAIDSGIPLTLTGSLVGFLQQFSYALPQFGLMTTSIFAGIGLVLVVIGVFGVMAYSVSLQTHEIGVRMALGAQPEDVLMMVIRKGLMLIGTGIVIGLFASAALTRFIASQLFGVSSTDPWTFGTVVVVIITAGLIACYIPARRASRVDPLVALRYE
jgi:putative ABC transport system permease protein